MNLEYILKQFYFLEKIAKNYVDKNLPGEFIFDFSQKIPYQVLEIPNIEENLINVPHSKIEKIEKIDHTQSLSVLNMNN